MDCEACPADDSYWCDLCSLVDAIETTDFDFNEVTTVAIEDFMDYDFPLPTAQE